MEIPKPISPAKRKALIALAVASFPWLTVATAAIGGAGFAFNKCSGEDDALADDDDSSYVAILDEDD